MGQAKMSRAAWRRGASKPVVISSRVVNEFSEDKERSGGKTLWQDEVMFTYPRTGDGGR